MMQHEIIITKNIKLTDTITTTAIIAALVVVLVVMLVTALVVVVLLLFVISKLTGVFDDKIPLSLCRGNKDKQETFSLCGTW